MENPPTICGPKRSMPASHQCYSERGHARRGEGARTCEYLYLFVTGTRMSIFLFPDASSSAHSPTLAASSMTANQGIIDRLKQADKVRERCGCPTRR